MGSRIKNETKLSFTTSLDYQWHSWRTKELAFEGDIYWRGKLSYKLGKYFLISVLNLYLIALIYVYNISVYSIALINIELVYNRL